MNIEIKNSKKPIEYVKAIKFLEERIDKILKKKEKELIWVLEHPSIYTAGSTYKESEILDKSIIVHKTNRGGKITYHGPGQLIFYFVLDLNKKNKDIRKFINIIEKTIIETLNQYKIKSIADRKNIGIWVKRNKKLKKVAAIGIRVKKWIAYHGFSINIKTNLKNYEKIIPCGINDKDLINLCTIKRQNYNNLPNELIKNFLKNLKN
jgi:lipoyl(octanoyl) transferase